VVQNDSRGFKIHAHLGKAQDNRAIRSFAQEQHKNNTTPAIAILMGAMLLSGMYAYVYMYMYRYMYI